MSENLKIRRIVESRYILFFFSIFFLSVCVAILPSGLKANEGFSYFGVSVKTVVPYTIGLIFLSIYHYPGKAKFPFKIEYVLKLISFLLVGLVLVPYSVSDLFNNIHIGIGSTIFSLQLILSICFYVYSKKASFLYLLLIQFAFGLACALFVASKTGYLLQFQILYQIAFMTGYLNFLKYLKIKTSF